MSWIWWSKLEKTLGRRKGLSDELTEEIRAHLDMEIEENLSMGMSPEEARRIAQAEFGGATLIHERARESWMFYYLETFLQDLRYGLRTLARSPGLAATALLSLAIGIGANTALFGVVDAVMLRALPVPEPERLVLLTWTTKGWPDKFVDDVEGRYETDESTGVAFSVSFPSGAYDFLNGNNGVFSSLLAQASNDERINVGINGRAEDALMHAVSGNYFQTLGVPAAAGRSLIPDDDRPGAPPVVVLSYSWWRSRFAGDPSVCGRTIAINGTPVTVVGVAAREFSGLEPGLSTDLFVPLSLETAHHLRAYGTNLQDPRVWWLTLVGRLKPGVTPEQARREMGGLFHRSIGAGPAAASGEAIVPSLKITSASRGLGELRDEYSRPLLLLMAMVGLVLIIACANTAGLMLARATARKREISVRLSLGASRLRIVRQLLTEAVLLGILGGCAGLLFAKWIGFGVAALFAAAPYQPVLLSLRLDTRVLLFTAGISVAAGILFGLAPALRTGRMELYNSLRQHARAASGNGERRFLSGKALVCAQVALSLLLLVGAGLLVRTLQRLQRVELGFNPRNLLLFDVQPGLNGYKGTQLAAYYQDLEQRVRAVPGVKSVGMSQRRPVGDGWSQGRVTIPGITAAGKGVPYYRHWISAGYLEALQIPLVLGRGIGPRDAGSAPVIVVVNQRFVDEYLQGRNPIGLRFEAGSSFKAEIVGVAGDSKYSGLREQAPPTAYASYLQYNRDYPSSMTFEIRTEGEPGPVVQSMYGAVAAVDANIPLVKMKTMEEAIGQVLFMERTFAWLSLLFGIASLLLACVGLYGTMSYTVARRTNEFGIRLALGASNTSILHMVVRETLWIVAAGIGIGIPLVWGAGRLLESRLYGISAHDAGTLLASVAVIVGVTLAAGYVPARRASRVDPITALRFE
jgi:predicted permease